MTGTPDLYFFGTMKIQNFVVTVAFGFDYEINVFDVGVFLKSITLLGECPVRVLI